MAATFTWSIRGLERYTSNDGIEHADWLCSASETVGTGDDAVTHKARLGGKTHHTPDPSASDFIAYASVTEADVLGWVYGSLIVDDETADEAKARTEAFWTAKVQGQIDGASANSAGVPW